MDLNQARLISWRDYKMSRALLNWTRPMYCRLEQSFHNLVSRWALSHCGIVTCCTEVSCFFWFLVETEWRHFWRFCHVCEAAKTDEGHSNYFYVVLVVLAVLDQQLCCSDVMYWFHLDNTTEVQSNVHITFTAGVYFHVWFEGFAVCPNSSVGHLEGQFSLLEVSEGRQGSP
jgi:hypothetical protein